MLVDSAGYQLTTSRPDAAAAYRDATDALLSGRPTDAALRRALAADPDLAVAAALLVAQDRELSRVEADSALAAVARATRRERQHAEVMLALAGADHERVCALAVEHLREFPDDLPVAWAASQVPDMHTRAPQVVSILRQRPRPTSPAARSFLDTTLGESS